MMSNTTNPLYFYRSKYYQDNFIYQSRGFNNLKNLKISLSSTLNHVCLTYIEVLSIKPITHEINTIVKGHKEEVRRMFYVEK